MSGQLDDRRHGFYTPQEELANTLTHGAGALLGIAGLAILLRAAWPLGAGYVAGYAVYGGCLVAMYLASTCYHAVWGERLKQFCRRLDHCAIYLLIAGTYTPVMTVAIGGTLGGWLLGIVWLLAAVGIAFKCCAMRRFNRLSLVLYLTMGWLGIIAVKSLIAGMPPLALGLLVAGGVVYTLGVAFYVQDRPYCHAIWHLFVLGGSILQFFAVLNLA